MAEPEQIQRNQMKMRSLAYRVRVRIFCLVAMAVPIAAALIGSHASGREDGTTRICSSRRGFTSSRCPTISPRPSSPRRPSEFAWVACCSSSRAYPSTEP